MKYSSSSKSVLLLSLHFLFILSVGYCQSPVSQSANSMVDLNTGDFKYSLPVMSVPGPNGENVPIQFNYNGGIRMEQEASWIGLGWSYNPGEILHNVKGVSDDWKNKVVATTTTTYTGQTVEATNFYGPLYYSNTQTPSPFSSMDVSFSNYNLYKGILYYPNYDEYHVSGPGLNGMMEPRIFENNGCFMLNDKLGEYIDHGHLGTPFVKPASLINFVFKDDLNSIVSSNTGGYDPVTNRQITANYIEKFTNSEINGGAILGFLDYRVVASQDKRPVSDFDPNGIGAFRITTVDGMVYHYSLPVYNLEGEKNSSFVINSDYEIDITATGEHTEIVKSERYVVSWKLTAITGTDYADLNGNGIADIGDTGYWIAYNYGMWCSNYKWRAPFFNFSPNKFRPQSTFDASDLTEIYKNTGNVNTGQTQMYYLNNIQTASHTAFFIKDIRLDEHSIPYGNFNLVAPSLRLNKIVLLKNEDISSSFSLNASLIGDSRFYLGDCSPSSVEPHIGIYNANEAVIKAKSIAMAELTYDYSLCKMIYNNINNLFTVSPAIPDLYRKFDHTNGVSTTTDNANSGKLTFKEIKIFEAGYNKVLPSYQFDYDQTNSVKNPNYNCFKADIWGYYKSDYSYSTRGRYTTDGINGSNANVDAWSLKKITTPLGGEILIGYESDAYGLVNYGGSYKPVQRNFLITAATFSVNNNTVTVNAEINSFINSTTLINKTYVLPFRFTSDYSYLCGGLNIAVGNTNSGLTFSNGITSSDGSAQTYSVTGTDPFLGSTTGNTQCSGLTTTYTYNPFSFYLNGRQGWGHIGLNFSSTSGGGTRVKQITLRDPESNQSYVNEYEYESGAATSEPAEVMVREGALAIELNKSAYDPLMETPMVTYGKVTVKSKSLANSYNGKMIYTFQNTYLPFKTSSTVHNSLDAYFEAYQAYVDLLLQYQDNPEDLPIGTVPPIRPNVGVITFDCYSTEIIGILNSLKTITTLDNNNNIIESIQYEYQDNSSPSTPAQLPVVSQVFFQKSFIEYDGFFEYELTTKSTFSRRKGRLVKRVIHRNGITSIEEPMAWDPITGVVTKTRIIDPTNGVTESTTVLAYTTSEYASMGAKSKNLNNSNQLNAPLKTTISKDKIIRDLTNNLLPGGKMELTGGSKTTWQRNIYKRTYHYPTNSYINIITSMQTWSPYKTFVYNGDDNDANWREDGEVTLFNKRNDVLELKNGVGNRYSAIKFGYDQKYKICQASDAKYVDFTFSGFEDLEIVAPGITHFGGEVTNGEMRDAGTSIIKPHTGNYLAKVVSGYGPGYYAKGFTVGRSYRASVWVHKDSPSNATLTITLDGSHSNGGAPISINKMILKSDASNVIVNDWILMTLTIDVPADYIESGGSFGLNDLRVYLSNTGSSPAYFDDLMFRPLDAVVSGNVIDERTGRTLAVLDNQNFATKYVYDNSGRVKDVWVESPATGWKLRVSNSYNYKRTY